MLWRAVNKKREYWSYDMNSKENIFLCTQCYYYLYEELNCVYDIISTAMGLTIEE
jgi:hypothetical protein